MKIIKNKEWWMVEGGGWRVSFKTLWIFKKKKINLFLKKKSEKK